MLKGVAKVTTPRRPKLSSYELALKDLDEGRVYEAKDVDDLFNQIFSEDDDRFSSTPAHIRSCLTKNTTNDQPHRGGMTKPCA